MNLASLFNLAGPDLIIILLIVVFLYGIKRMSGPSHHPREGRASGDRFDGINVVLMVLVFIGALLLLNVLSSSH
jgi:hypothetical protein